MITCCKLQVLTDETCSVPVFDGSLKNVHLIDFTGWSDVQFDNVGAFSKPASNPASMVSEVKVTIATQTGIKEADKIFEMSNL